MSKIEEIFNLRKYKNTYYLLHRQVQYEFNFWILVHKFTSEVRGYLQGHIKVMPENVIQCYALIFKWDLSNFYGRNRKEINFYV